MKTSLARIYLILSLITLTVLTVLPQEGRAGRPSQTEPPSVHQQKAIYHPKGNEGTITGTIEFTGVPPKRTKIDMYADAACAEIKSEKLTEDVLVSDGKLANVFVYVKSSSVLDSYEFKAPSGPVVLEHKNCRYVPHLLGVRVGQTLHVLNDDPIAHNTNASARINEARRTLQPPGGGAIELQFTQPEAFILFKDNIHPWENAYVGVFSHPFFALSDDRGKYKIEGLPPGDYTIVAWHEKFGEQTIDIPIAPDESRTLNFMFE